MSEPSSRQIVIAGGGIAGLTAAVAFAGHGYSVRIFERAAKLEETGAGIQLSPNATRLLKRLGVLDAVRSVAVRPEAVVLRDGRSLRELARIGFGEAAEVRWGAPYLVVHRADLQSALLARIAREADIRLDLDAPLRDAAIHARGVTAAVEIERRAAEISGLLLVGADGVHSTVRGFGGSDRAARFAGEVAWRTTIASDSPAGQRLLEAVSANVVTAFLRPGFHLIAYPVRAGAAVNLVAFTKATTPLVAAGESDAVAFSDLALRRELAQCAPPLRGLAEDGIRWTEWPIYVVDPKRPWSSPKGVALIGDAAHAMTPYAAQGAAMAIEDAVTLADAVAARPAAPGDALRGWEKLRRPRIAAVGRRAAFNRFAWHASGPIALARNLVLARRSGAQLAGDLDWLYGWKPAGPL